jgi:hypothetical protein
MPVIDGDHAAELAGAVAAVPLRMAGWRQPGSQDDSRSEQADTLAYTRVSVSMAAARSASARRAAFR